MIQPEQINHIMVELGLDPQDSAARKTVERLIASKPELPMNEQFFAQLRAELQEQAAQMVPHQSTSSTNNFASMLMNKILASALVVMIVVAGGGFWYIQNRTDKPLFQSPATKEANQLLSGKYEVSDADAESFGDLNKVAIINSNEAAKLNSAVNNSQSAAMAETSTVAMGNAGTGGGTASTGDIATTPAPDKLIAPGEPYPAPESYSFVYEGTDISAMLNKDQSVLKRRLPVQSAGVAERIINLLSFGLIDLTKFRDLKMQYITFMEDREYGYSMSVDLHQGTVNIGQNWEKWPQQENVCDANYCGPLPRFTAETYPKDSEAINTADAFLKEYGISLEAYGKPQVIEQQWRIMYAQASESEKANFYFPEQVSVIYPLVLEGKEVMDEGGNPSGLNVMVDVRQKKVSGIYELTTKQFEKSTYTGETDSDRILKIVQNGGFRNYPYVDPNVKLTTLKLDTPTLQLVKLWYASPSMYSSNSRMSSYGADGGELYVPALVFPIKNQGNYWRKNVIVPLVKDILDSDASGGQPMPVDLPVSTPPSSGGAVSEPAVPVRE